ncbi:hypothetical protein AB6D11_03195 [Vibrio splendidus]
MNNTLTYKVVQYNNEGNITSLLHTRSILIAIADLMAKSKMPIDFKTAKTKNMSLGTVQIYQPFNEGEDPSSINLRMIIHKKHDNSLYSTTELVSDMYYQGVEGVDEISHDHYKSDTYYKSLSHLSSKLHKQCGLHPQALMILAVLAGETPEHPLWGNNRYLKRKRSLG